jgi:hypothetical protein
MRHYRARVAMINYPRFILNYVSRSPLYGIGATALPLGAVLAGYKKILCMTITVKDVEP